jgi:hypothetical protein
VKRTCELITIYNIYIYIYIHSYIHSYARTHAHTYIRSYIHSFIHSYARTHTHTCIHTHTYIHTYIHTYKLKLSHYTPWRRLGERRYSSYTFLTWALDRDERSASRPGRALTPGKVPPVPLYRRQGGPQSRSGHRGYRKNPFVSAGDRTSIARSSSP